MRIIDLQAATAVAGMLAKQRLTSRFSLRFTPPRASRFVALIPAPVELQAAAPGSENQPDAMPQDGVR